MKKFRSEALNRFLKDEERAARILMNIPMAIILVFGVIALLSIMVVR